MSQNSGSCRIDFEQKTEKMLERGKNRHNFALFSFGFVFTACSADDDLSNENPLDNNQVIVAGENDAIKQPIALKYEDFITSYDVEILDADTTQIAVSKAYAAKLRHEDNVKTLSVCEKVLKDLMVDSRLNAHRRILGELRFESLIASAVKDYIAQYGEESLKNYDGFDNTYVLGVQHLFAMFGATVLVPLLTGLDVSVTLLFAGIGTLIFHFVSKWNVPVFLGSSFAFLGGYASVKEMGVAQGLSETLALDYDIPRYLTSQPSSVPRMVLCQRYQKASLIVKLFLLCSVSLVLIVC